MKKTIFILGSLTIALMPNIACSNLDSDRSLDGGITNQVFSNNRQASAIFDPLQVVESSNRIVNEIGNNNELFERIRNASSVEGQYIDQGILDDLINIADFKEYKDQFDLKLANTLIAENLKVYELGYEKYIDQTRLSEFTKEIAKEMIANQYNIEQDITKVEGFEQISENEQSMLVQMQDTSRVVPESSGRIPLLVGGLVYGAIGAGIGGLAGPGGALIGGAIGFVVGFVHMIFVNNKE